MFRALSILVFTLASLLMTGPSQAQRASEEVKIATYNAFLTTIFFNCFNPNFLDCILQLDGRAEDWANELADAILSDPNRPDIIAINEAWDEKAKDVLVNRLSAAFPNYVRDIDADLIQLRGPTLVQILQTQPQDVITGVFGQIEIDKINGEDSGLMLFANEKFTFEDLPDASFQWGTQPDQQLDASTDQVAFTLYDSCESEDCFAAKGAALVRLRKAGTERIYDVVFTHMQADDPPAGDFFPAVRQNQFEAIRKLLDTTLGGLPQPDERVIVLGDMNVAIPSAQAEWDTLFAGGGQVTGWPAYDTWARTTSRRDAGITNQIDNERLDYILASPQPYSNNDPGDPPPVCVQHLTVPRLYQALASDHYLVQASLNLGFDFCSPRIAYDIPLSPALTSGDPDEQLVIDADPNSGNDITRIAHPGGMQWFHVKRDGAGTYTLGVDNTSVSYQLYAPEDLTNPISRYNKVTRTVVVGERKFAVDTFVLPPEFYIRVAGNDPDDTPNYAFWIKHHTCATQDEACILQPGQPQAATLTRDNNPFGRQDQAWFAFDVVGVSDTGANQQITVYGEAPADPNFKTTLQQFADPAEPEPGPFVDGVRTSFVGPMSEGATGYLVIEQAGGTPNDVRVVAGMDTSLRYLTPFDVVCRDETNPEFGSDDIYVNLKLDGVLIRSPLSGDLSFDCDEPQHSRPWSNFSGVGTYRFTQSAAAQVVEADVADDDTAPYAGFPALPQDQNFVDGTKVPLTWTFGGGNYRMGYFLEKRLNEPVK